MVSTHKLPFESLGETPGPGRAALWLSSLVFTDSQREDLE